LRQLYFAVHRIEIESSFSLLTSFSLSSFISPLCCIEKVDSTISVAHIFQLTKFVIITRWYFDHATSYVPHILATIYTADKRTSSRRGKFRRRGKSSRKTLAMEFQTFALTERHIKNTTQKRNYLCCTVWQEYGERVWHRERGRDRS